MAVAGRPRLFDEFQVLEAAMMLFWEKGYEGTSLSELRVATGLSSASIYHAFGSKEGLFERAITHYAMRPGSVQTIAADQSLPAAVMLSRLLHASIEAQNDPSHPGGCMIALSATVVPMKNGFHPAAIVAAQRRRDQDCIRVCVSRFVAEHALFSSTSIDAITVLVHTFILGLSIQIRDGVSVAALHSAADLLLQAWDVNTA